MRLTPALAPTTATLTLSSIALFAALRAQTTAPPASLRIDQFQNPAAHVWKTTLYPGAPLTLHRHDHPRTLVALTDGTLDLVDSTGTHDLHILKKDQAYWLPAMPPGAMHKDVNPGTTPLELMVIELEKEN
jgi:hypothetical protein